MTPDDSTQTDTIPRTDPAPQTGVTPAMWLRAIVVIFLFPAALLFGSAGTLDWFMAWLYLGLTVALFAISRFIVWRTTPDLLRERGQMMDHEDTAPFDRLLAPLAALVCPTLIALIAGLAVRFDWQPSFSPLAQWAGVGFFLLGAALGTWALVVNRFFSGVVRIQHERGHTVVTSGPYAIVRHPGYLGAIVSYLGMVLMLGSPWALFPFALQIVLLVVRTMLEDRYLQAELPGYAGYARQVRFRLVPAIW